VVSRIKGLLFEVGALNRIITIFVLFVFCIFSSSCKKSEWFESGEGEQIARLVSILYVTDGQPNCGCGQSAYLENTGTSNHVVEVEETRKHYGEIKSQHTNRYSVAAGKKQFIGCTRNSYLTSSNIACDQFNTFKIVKRISKIPSSEQWQYLSPKIEFAYWKPSQKELTKFVSTEPVKSIGLETDYPNSCAFHCALSDEYCLKVGSEITNRFIEQVGRLSDLIAVSDKIIKKSDIMNAFEVDTDECRRGDTLINGGMLSNAGGACVVSASLDFGVRSDEALTLTIGPELRAKLQTGAGTLATFAYRQTSALLEIRNKNLDSEFGGYITSASYKNGKFVLGTENGCLEFQ
jgi:hypothetical protein